MRVFVPAFATLAIVATLANGRMIQPPTLSPLAGTLGLPSAKDSSLVRRLEWNDDWGNAASPEAAADAFCKGTLLMTSMITNDNNAGRLFSPQRQSARSQFANFPYEFHRWGWDIEDSTEDKCEHIYSMGLDEALRDIGIEPQSSFQGGTLSCWDISHYYPDEDENEEIDQGTYQVDGNTYRMTGGRFLLLIDPTNGLLVALAQYSPAHMGQFREPKVEGPGLPQLKAASDVMWGAYQVAGGTNNVRWFMAVSIENRGTLAIIKHTLDEAGTELLPWPGLFVRTDSDAGKRLIGTPNGKGFAFILTQHKAELGRKFISGVRIFHSNLFRGEPALAFQVSDVPPGIGE